MKKNTLKQKIGAGRVSVGSNTKSVQQGVTIVDGKGKTAHSLSRNGASTVHVLTADTVALVPFETMFVIW